MPISSVGQRNIEEIPSSYKTYAWNRPSTFAGALRRQQAEQSSAKSPPAAAPEPAAPAPSAPELTAPTSAAPVPTGSHAVEGSAIVQVGQISAATPTVSQVLHNNPEFEHNYWQIINSEANKNKAFNKIQDGDILSLNRQTNELFWEKPPAVAGKSRLELIQMQLKAIGRKQDSTVTLGRLDKAHPTVSQLLTGNGKIRNFTWDVIEAGINKGKPFAALPEGTIVRIDPETLELHFTKPTTQHPSAISTPEKAQPAPAVEKLSGLDVLKLQLQDLAPEHQPILLGTVSDDLPTVTQILENNKHTQKLYKEIVYSDSNRNKPYRNLQAGTRVCIDPVTLELIFEGPQRTMQAQALPPGTCESKQMAEMPKSERLQQYVAGLQTDADKMIKIGSISDEVPTVSQLLVRDPRFAGFQWDIILSGVNQDKPYTRLPPGTEVSINPANLELLFNPSPQPDKTMHEAPQAREEKAPAPPPPPTEPTKTTAGPVAQEAEAVQTPKPQPEAAPPTPPPTEPAKTMAAPVTHEAEAVQTPALQPEAGKPAASEANVSVPSAAQPEKEQARMQPAAEAPQPPAAAPQAPEKSGHPLAFNDTLAFAAGQMVGRPTTEIDSYKLLLLGLEARGIKYEGENGLKENLDRLASLIGENKTALQSVDGLIRVAGETVYAKTIGPQASKAQLAVLDKEISHHLKNGLIMTLSTPAMQQSGIVSTQDNRWTLINSQDKMVDEIPISDKLTELHDKAAASHENLTVKVSSLQEDVLRNVDKMLGLKQKEMEPASNITKHGIEQNP